MSAIDDNMFAVGVCTRPGLSPSSFGFAGSMRLNGVAKKESRHARAI